MNFIKLIDELSTHDEIQQISQTVFARKYDGTIVRNPCITVTVRAKIKYFDSRVRNRLLTNPIKVPSWLSNESELYEKYMSESLNNLENVEQEFKFDIYPSNIVVRHSGSYGNTSCSFSQPIPHQCMEYFHQDDISNVIINENYDVIADIIIAHTQSIRLDDAYILFKYVEWYGECGAEHITRNQYDNK